MYAIVDIAGQQFKVEKDQEIFVNRLEGDEGSNVEFFDVLLIDNNGKITVGSPKIHGAMVSCKIIEHMKGDKVLVFKKKRRKGFKRIRGHRDFQSKIVIENIIESGAKPKATPQKEAKPKTKAKPKAEVKKEIKKAPAITTTAKKEEKPTTESKPAAKPKTASKPKVQAKPKETKPTAESKSKASAKPKSKTEKPEKEEKPSEPKDKKEL